LGLTFLGFDLFGRYGVLGTGFCNGQGGRNNESIITLRFGRDRGRFGLDDGNFGITGGRFGLLKREMIECLNPGELYDLRRVSFFWRKQVFTVHRCTWCYQGVYTEYWRIWSLVLIFGERMRGLHILLGEMVELTRRDGRKHIHLGFAHKKGHIRFEYGMRIWG
jgi:hypothetical protein